MSLDDGKVPEAIPPFTTSPEPGGNTLHVQVNTPNLSINLSSMTALKEIAAANPEVAMRIIDASRESVKAETTKYALGAAGSALVALSMIVGFVVTIVFAGSVAGLLFFVICAAAAAIFSAVFTGKSQSLEWTVGLFRSDRADT